MWHRQMLSYGRKKMLKTGQTPVGEPPEMTHPQHEVYAAAWFGLLTIRDGQ